jgi:RNA polymerase-binding transcription factor DksA
LNRENQATHEQETVREEEAMRQELRALEEQIKDLKASLAVKPDYGMGKGDPSITRWELDQALLERLQNHAEELRLALARISEGTYGLCESCGKRINPDRLAILPDTNLCAECARKKR